MRRRENRKGTKHLVADQRATCVTITAGRPNEAAMSRAVEARVYNGNNFDRIAKVRG